MELLIIFPAILPEVPPEPICKVPAETVVSPVYVLSPSKVSVFEANFVTVPVPLITPEYVCASERLKVTFALLTILPVTLPEVPPAPICKVPAETVVPPVIVEFPARVSVPASNFVKPPTTVSEIPPLMVSVLPESTPTVTFAARTEIPPPRTLSPASLNKAPFIPVAPVPVILTVPKEVVMPPDKTKELSPKRKTYGLFPSAFP